MTVTELVQSYLASFESADPDQIVAHVSEQFENEQVGLLGQGCQGRETYRQRLAGFLQTFQKLRYSVEEMIEADGRVAVAYKMTAEDEGKPIAIRGVMIIFTEAGQITKRSDYWDGLTYQQQIGEGA